MTYYKIRRISDGKFKGSSSYRPWTRSGKIYVNYGSARNALFYINGRNNEAIAVIVEYEVTEKGVDFG